MECFFACFLKINYQTFNDLRLKHLIKKTKCLMRKICLIYKNMVKSCALLLKKTDIDKSIFRKLF